MQIGCQSHKINAWFQFSDAEISKMDRGAFEWWNKWKDVIKSMIELSPCEK